MEKRCYVVDDKGEVIISGALVIKELFRDIDCQVSTHVLIKYHTCLDDALIGRNDKISIFPKNRVYCFEMGNS